MKGLRLDGSLGERPLGKGRGLGSNPIRASKFRRMSSTANLYKTHPDDNVATALADIEGGETVSIVSSEGQIVGSIRVAAHVPKFFKVALAELQDGELIRKWGSEIGRIVARVHNTRVQDSEAAECIASVAAGFPLHVGNFIPSDVLLDFWHGSLSTAFNLIVEQHRRGQSAHAPYEFGVAKRRFSHGQQIKVSDLNMDGRLRKLLLPETDFVVGCALGSIGPNNSFRLGYCVDLNLKVNGLEEIPTFMTPFYHADERMVQVISQYYRFIKGRVYEIA